MLTSCYGQILPLSPTHGIRQVSFSLYLSILSLTGILQVWYLLEIHHHHNSHGMWSLDQTLLSTMVHMLTIIGNSSRTNTNRCDMMYSCHPEIICRDSSSQMTMYSDYHHTYPSQERRGSTITWIYLLLSLLKDFSTSHSVTKIM